MIIEKLSMMQKKKNAYMWIYHLPYLSNTVLHSLIILRSVWLTQCILWHIHGQYYLIHARVSKTYVTAIRVTPYSVWYDTHSELTIWNCVPTTEVWGLEIFCYLKECSFFLCILAMTAHFSRLGWVKSCLIYSNMCICSFNSDTIDSSQ